MSEKLNSGLATQKKSVSRPEYIPNGRDCQDQAKQYKYNCLKTQFIKFIYALFFYKEEGKAADQYPKLESGMHSLAT